MFWKKKTIENVAIDNSIIENNNNNINNNDVVNNITKSEKQNKVSNVKWNLLWAKNSLNFNEFGEKLVNKGIITTNDLKILLDNKPDWFFYKSIISFLDDIILFFWKEKESEILENYFHLELWYNIQLSANTLTPSTTILDLFNINWTKSFTQEIIDNIFKIWILPIQINSENKINSLTVISRSPELPNNLLSVFKDLIDKKQILDMEFILVNKDTYNEVIIQLEDNEYSHTI